MPDTTPPLPKVPTIGDIEAAAERLAGVAVLTPLLESPLLNERLGGRLLVKAEPLQRTGSFKFRGAFNRISRIPAETRVNGVVAYSSGNHAQGVAAAAKMSGIAATIIMPADAPAIKRRNTEAWGARVVSYDRYREVREKIGSEIAAETGATLVKPYDDPDVVAGQGTTGLEIAAQCKALGVAPDAVLVCCGGGGLTAGIAIALADRLPGTKVHVAEPEGYDSTGQSLAAGERISVDPARKSVCDALLAPAPGVITFEINRHLVAGGLTITDDEAFAAMATAFEHFKLVLEPGGAAALAAALSGRMPMAGKTVVAIASGGNVDPAIFAKALTLTG